MPQINASTIEGANGSLPYSETPDECPICLRGTNPRAVGGVVVGVFNSVGSKLTIAFQCTWNDCNETFLAYYVSVPGKGYSLLRVAPKNAAKAVFPDSITAVSPDFVKIYNQAMMAESIELDQITGIGLRKALEFLIKDFLINQEPTKADEIKGKLLGKCINDYVADPNIKATAKLATWLGNDETHYVKRWEDKDINDLKVLIRLTVNWIDSVLLTQQYVKEMNP